MRRLQSLTAESVSVGHPDSYMDYVVNSILDEYLRQDPNTRFACDGVVKNKYITLGGEITSKAKVDIKKVIEKCTKDIGYDFKPKVKLHIYEQSPDIAQGTNDKVQGAGDQGTITGYACSSNKAMIPLEKALADALITIMYREIRLNNPVYTGNIKSDMKSQVTISYNARGVANVDTVVFACQHAPGFSNALITSAVKSALVKAIKYVKSDDKEITTNNTKYIVNGTGQFILGGPEADSGEVGRKIVVDAYGVSVPVGGGTYNGKDPSKVDRSAAYMARYVAKHIVAAGLAKECLITVSYCIGVPKPVSIDYNFFGTQKADKDLIIKACNSLFDFSPAGIKKELFLDTFSDYATAGLMCHFGAIYKETLDSTRQVYVPWEGINNKKLERLKKLKYVKITTK